MAEKQMLVCDECGSSLDTQRSALLLNEQFAWEIDLCAEHQAALQNQLNSLLLAGRRVSQRTAKANRRKTFRRAPYEAAEGVNLSAVRAWAVEHGIPVSGRGRIDGRVIGLFKQAQTGGPEFLSSPETLGVINALRK